MLPSLRQTLATSLLCVLSAHTQVVVTTEEVVNCNTAAATHSDVSREKSIEVFEVGGFEVNGPSSGHSVGTWRKIQSNRFERNYSSGPESQFRVCIPKSVCSSFLNVSLKEGAHEDVTMSPTV